MTINKFLALHYLHDSLLEKVVYKNNAVDLTIDFCFWMQEGYQEGDPETGIIHLHFPGITDFSGPTGDIDDYSILETEYQDNTVTVLLMDDFNNTTYTLKFTSVTGEVSLTSSNTT